MSSPAGPVVRKCGSVKDSNCTPQRPRSRMYWKGFEYTLACQAIERPPDELSAIGRKGGKIGGAARAAALTATERKAIARKAAAARWEAKRKK